MPTERSAALERMFPPSAEAKAKAKDERCQMTNAERKVWEIVRRKNILRFKFRRKHPMGAFVVDFYCPACLLAIEVIERDIDEQTDLDRAKFTWLTAHGVDVLQVSAREVAQDEPAVVAQILEACERSGAWWYETEEARELPFCVRGVFHHGAAFPLESVEGMEDRPVIITFLDEA